jgi:uncharacterized protein YcbK (DUF882 family)
MRSARTKKPLKRTAIQKRQVMAAEAREKFPTLLERVNELREKAKEAFEPRYTPQKLRSDIIKLAKKWRRSDKVDMRLGQIERLFELAPRQRANKYAVLVNAICPDGVDRRIRSRLSKKVEKSLSRPPTQQKKSWGPRKKPRVS